MKLDKIIEELRKLTENLDRDTFKKIFDKALIDYEAADDERILEYKASTLYNDYPYYISSYASQGVMLVDDYVDYSKDISRQFAFTLPDKFDLFFDSDELYSKIMSDESGYYLSKSVEFINKVDSDADIPKLIKRDEVSVDGINYVIIEEV